MTQKPLVSVVCLCYNQARFVEEAINSVLMQTYANIQLIVVDDASTDHSAAIIKQIVSQHPSIEYLLLTENLGNCRAFNRGLTLAKGEFIIDFAADDVFMPERIERQVEFFSTLDASYGVVFTDAIYIDERGKFLREHYAYLFWKKLLKVIPEGDVYRHVLSRYFICSPTMIVRKEVMDELHGYDEALSYEDFDFWVRSSRTYRYAYLDRKLTKVRRSARSMSTGWYRQGDRQLHSTYLVCKKALALNRTEEDHRALALRLKYELRQSVFSENRTEADHFYVFLRQINRTAVIDHLLWLLNKFRLPLSFLRRWYHQVRYS